MELRPTRGTGNGCAKVCWRLLIGVQFCAGYKVGNRLFRQPLREVVSSSRAAAAGVRARPHMTVQQPAVAAGPCRCSCSCSSPEHRTASSRWATSAMLRQAGMEGGGWGGGAAEQWWASCCCAARQPDNTCIIAWRAVPRGRQASAATQPPLRPHLGRKSQSAARQSATSCCRLSGSFGLMGQR